MSLEMKFKSTRHLIWIVPIIILLGACDSIFNTKPETPREPPFTQLANIPIEGDTLFALVELHWDGGSNDGFVASYEYRFTTESLETGERTTSEWFPTQQTSQTIAFSSPEELNLQIFEVRAIDDEGNVDPDPPSRMFYTTQAIPPHIEIATPRDGTSQFYQSETTDWYEGVHLTFSGEVEDEEAEIVEYGWAVGEVPRNREDWIWTPDTTVHIPPDMFEAPQAGESIEQSIHVTAKDNTDLLSEPHATVTINLVTPSFEKDVLIINETNADLLPRNIDATWEDITRFYADAFGIDPEHSWNFHEEGELPPREVMGDYKMIVWVADNEYAATADAHRIGQVADELAEYMNIGGHMFMSGWRILNSFMYAEDPRLFFPHSFDRGTFVHDYLHITDADESPAFQLPAGDFIGAVAVSDLFDHLIVDQEKLRGGHPPLWSGQEERGGLTQVNTIPGRAGFTETIYAFGLPDDDAIGIGGEPSAPRFRRAAVGIRYHGTAFDAFVFGFPMFFIEEEDVGKMAQSILEDLGI